jgi:hypothetical protein
MLKAVRSLGLRAGEFWVLDNATTGTWYIGAAIAQGTGGLLGAYGGSTANSKESARVKTTIPFFACSLTYYMCSDGRAVMVEDRTSATSANAYGNNVTSNSPIDECSVFVHSFALRLCRSVG